jgi:hypothetical protein
MAAREPRVKPPGKRGAQAAIKFEVARRTRLGRMRARKASRSGRRGPFSPTVSTQPPQIAGSLAGSFAGVRPDTPSVTPMSSSSGTKTAGNT